MVELTSYLLHLNSVYWGEIKLFENKTTTYCSVKIYVVTIWPATPKDIYTKSYYNLDLLKTWGVQPEYSFEITVAVDSVFPLEPPSK